MSTTVKQKRQTPNTSIMYDVDIDIENANLPFSWQPRSQTDEPPKELIHQAVSWVVRNRVLEKYPGVDEQDAKVLLLLLVEIKAINYTELFAGTCLDVGMCNNNSYEENSFLHWSLKTATRERNDILENEEPSKQNHQHQRGRRITKVFLGDMWSTPYDFHTPRVYQLLGQLDALDRLIIERAAYFRLADALARFPNLKYLQVRTTTSNTTFGNLNLLRETNKLEHLVMFRYKISNAEDFSSFLLDVLPLLPNLTKFESGWNSIASFQKVAQEIENRKRSNPHQFPSRSQLRNLNLGYYDAASHEQVHKIQQTIKKPKELDSIRTLLEAFPLLHQIRGAYGLYKFPPLVEYWLELNYTGCRVLVEGTLQHQKQQQQKTNASSSQRAVLPVSVWPLVLSRSWRGSQSKHLDGIYHLIKHVPALQGNSSMSI